jgi:3-dehydroquinate synthase
MVDIPAFRFFMLTITSQSHDYTVETFDSLAQALDAAAAHHTGVYYLVDRAIQHHFGLMLSVINPEQIIFVEATEEEKLFDRLTPIFLDLLQRGIKRDGLLVVIGGGVLQDIGCFIASVLFRGLHWNLIPTTLLAQADSCIGSKSSINIGSYKNQIGTFFPPQRILLTSSVLTTLPWDEIRSGLGEVIKLQLIKGQADFEALMKDLSILTRENQLELLSKWIRLSMTVKKPYIEADEYDRGIRNILNYGHTFGHAYESATHYAIPHGIAVLLGMLTATYLSARLNLIPMAQYSSLKAQLSPWHSPYGAELLQADRETIFQAIKHDKKNMGNAVHCILTRGPGRMEKIQVDYERDLKPAIGDFISRELTA